MAKWDKIQSRGNVQDRRGSAPAAIGGISMLGVALVIGAALLGGPEAALNVVDVLDDVQPVSTQQSVATGEYAGEDSYEVFASTVLGSSNDMWRELFDRNNIEYVEPELVLFRGATQSLCGGASSAVGPHYCSIDETIYLDETFFDELESRFGAQGGDVAEAYVISHEVAHHVQNKLGIMDQVRDAQIKNARNKNELSIKQELQADCFAGMWAYTLRDQDVFEKNEILEAIDAAEAVGDDRIQESIQGRVNPESWTHGSSEDRKAWFTKGYETGDFNQCDTFG